MYTNLCIYILEQPTKNHTKLERVADIDLIQPSEIDPGGFFIIGKRRRELSDKHCYDSF